MPVVATKQNIVKDSKIDAESAIKIETSKLDYDDSMIPKPAPALVVKLPEVPEARVEIKPVVLP